MRKRLFFNKLLVIFTIICYGCVLVSPARFWAAGFLAIIIPVLLVVNLLCAGWWLVKKRYKYALYSLGALLVGYKFLALTFTWSIHSSEPPQFTVLNYNVRVFNAYRHLNKKFIASRNIINWAKEDDADIKCFQEFYNMDKSRIFNTTKQLSREGKYHSFVKKAITDLAGGQFGVAIFSRFPIINTGEVNLRDRSYNDAIFADVLIGKDTVRIYNVHLQSMKISEQRMIGGDNLKENMIELARRLKGGFSARAKQVDIITEHVNRCPYRVVLCGDLNDIPYSYTYFKIKDHLLNSYESAGKGFGFTYNGKLFFLRIDNQFFGNGMRVHSHRVHREVGYSDHFPVKVGYSIGNQN